jgi:Protein of unknown function (DUF2971)
MRSPLRRHDLPFLYKYASASTALTILGSQTLRWSSPLILNDPFDVSRQWESFTLLQLEDALISRFRAYLLGEARPGSEAATTLLEAFRSKSGIVPEEQMLRDLRFFLRLMAKPLEKYLDDFRNAWTERLPNLRILCFSQDPVSPTMWTHYGQLHTGVVLQFETSDDRDSTWLLAEPVIYQSAKPQLPSALEWARAFLEETTLDWDVFLREYEYVKHTDWSYEREYRVVSAKKKAETGLYGDYAFHPHDLRGVILGAKTSPEDEGAIRAALAAGYPEAVLHRAFINQDSPTITIVAT